MAEIQVHADVQTQLDDLARFYRDYSAESTRLEHQHTGIQRIGEWFSGANKFANDTMHSKFYDEVQARVTALEKAIAALPDPAEADQAAQRAIAILFDPVEESQRDVGDWMRFAAEPLLQPLLPYLDREALQALYDRYNWYYPKRLQFPTQKKLRKAMEALLKAK